ncbi:MAG: TonB-dependent receptor SusC [Haliscomenobacter sp.]|jgi:TonB-linked SusC/RagA family outer membrane protein|nr:TonB-dependent receptor SusC [Haliscomenobacter sp.]
MNAKALLVCVGILLMGVSSLWAQRRISGTVTDAASGEPLIGANVLVVGTGEGTVTDFDGKYELSVPAGYDRLQFSYTGYTSQEINLGASDVMDVQLEAGEVLDEIVVVGYGSTKKKDLTGSVTAITSKDFIRGNIATPEQLVNGKVAGVQITSNGGAPGSGSRIRIRGGSSLNASNDPLIVIDGVPLDNGGITGSANALSFINPNDIESFNILKDASATAIYGSRASNGVIIITTKKGARDSKLNVNFSTLFSVANKTDIVDVLSPDEFRDVVNGLGTSDQKKLLGTANTNWQEEIYRTALSTDNNLSLTGAIKGIPFRASASYLGQQGILKRSDMDRISGSLGLSPVVLDDKLKIDVNLKMTNVKNFFANQGAIGTAVYFDPTQTIEGNQWDGYFEWLDPTTQKPNTLAPRNPLALLNTRDDESTVNRLIGNVQLDYRFHFLPDLRANLNVGMDKSNSEGDIFVPATASQAFTRNGVVASYAQEKQNQLLEFYLNYSKEIAAIKSRVELMGGYSWQDFVSEGNFLDLNTKQDTFENTRYKTQNTLVSFFGRANYSLMDRYLLTFTLRRDGSSRFSPDTRWGLFPSAAFAWKISEEGFLKGNGVVSDLKLRLGYGVTGQQDIGSDYPYLARFTPGEPTAQYQFGSSFVSTLRPEGYDANIKWEETETYNAGLDFGFLDGRIQGSIDYYFKKTKDLLATIPVPAGSNLTNFIFTNVGNIENRGVELVLNGDVIRQSRFGWNAGFNITFNKNEITNLTKVYDPKAQGILVGGIDGGVGNTIQIHSVGYPTNAFYVMRQVYDLDGSPIEGLYVDENGDGKSTLDDRYRYKSPDPQVYLGFTSQFTFDKLSLSFVLRSNLGNYMYNNINSNRAVYREITLNNVLRNTPVNLLDTKFTNSQYFSDYYLENASFLRLDNVTIGYNVGPVMNNKANVQLSLIGQNLMTVTNYTGLDPEIPGGIDNNFYPRPRTISFGLNVNF